jgi:hypothetical protein
MDALVIPDVKKKFRGLAKNDVTPGEANRTSTTLKPNI